MLDETLAERYSEALYQMAREAGEAGQQFRELQKIVELFADHRELRHALKSPAISRDVKKNIIRHLAEGRVQPRTLHFLYLVVDKGRELYLPAILRLYERKLHSDEGIVEAKVEVAFPLDSTMEDQIRAHLAELTGKKVQMEVRVRPELIGGAVITVGDRLFDGSVRTHLEKMRERLAQA